MNIEQKFDDLVNLHNDYLEQKDNKGKKQKINPLRHILKGLASIFNPLTNCRTAQSLKTHPSIFNSHPIYSRSDLSPAQKDAVLLGSDWKRAMSQFDKDLSNSYIRNKDDLKKLLDEREKCTKMYEYYRNVFVRSTLR